MFILAVFLPLNKIANSSYPAGTVTSVPVPNSMYGAYFAFAPTVKTYEICDYEYSMSKCYSPLSSQNRIRKPQSI